MDTEFLAEQLYQMLLGSDSYPIRLRANDPPTDKEFERLNKIVAQAVDILQYEDYWPKNIVLPLLNIESGLSQGLAFYADLEAERLEDWRDRIVATVETLYD